MKFLGAVNEAPTLSIASAATVAIGTMLSDTVIITGTTAITGFGTVSAGTQRRVIFAGPIKLVYNVTSMQLLMKRNIATAIGDIAEFLSLGAGNWMMTSYTCANGQPMSVRGGTSIPWYGLINL